MAGIKSVIIPFDQCRRSRNEQWRNHKDQKGEWERQRTKHHPHIAQ